MKMKKKFMSALFAAVVLVMSMTGTLCSETPFHDVPMDSYYYEDVMDLYDRGIVNGSGNSAFRPDDPVTYGEFLSMLFRMQNVDLSECEMGPEEHWAMGAGIYARHMLDPYEISLTDEGLNKPIPRKIAVKVGMMSYNYICPTKAIYLENPFNDVEASHQGGPKGNHVDWMLNAYHLGLIEPDKNGDLNPNGVLTRAEACSVLRNMESADLSNNKTILIPNNFDSINYKFIGDNAYTYYNDLASALDRIPDNVLAHHKASGARIIITDENQSRYVGNMNVDVEGCYLDNGDIILFTGNTPTSMFSNVSSTACHEMGHYVYFEMLSNEDKQLVKKSFNSSESDLFAKAVRREYCKTDVNEYFAELAAHSWSDRSDKTLDDCGCDIGLSVVRKFEDVGLPAE